MTKWKPLKVEILFLLLFWSLTLGLVWSAIPLSASPSDEQKACYEVVGHAVIIAKLLRLHFCPRNGERLSDS
jgi:hypothetical protein